MSANETDPLATRLSGTDPQSLLEYITRQRIYDSRFWKEECFGLTTAHVLEKAAQLQSIGGLSNHFLSLLLKLLQLHPEHELIERAFIQQDDFKYVRALGALYIRLTSRPVEIYETLEPLLSDARRMRVWVSPQWQVLSMDEYIHNLLHKTQILTMALPRLPARRFLEEAGYIAEGPRPTALQEAMDEHGGPLEYLKHLAIVERHAGAMAAWTKRGGMIPSEEETKQEVVEERTEQETSKPKKKKKKKDRNYDNLFKKTSKAKSTTQPTDDAAGPPEGSDEYWNEQRAKLGLGKLK